MSMLIEPRMPLIAMLASLANSSIHTVLKQCRTQDEEVAVLDAVAKFVSSRRMEASGGISGILKRMVAEAGPAKKVAIKKQKSLKRGKRQRKHGKT
jgi:hypothetical protein